MLAVLDRCGVTTLSAPPPVWRMLLQEDPAASRSLPELPAPLGAGGMGEVYRAWDTRLARAVAIKVLSGELSGDASRLRRFEKEARSASALNHPNIVTIYEIGSADSVSYIAMERVDVDTLREILLGGALSMKRMFSALNCALRE